MKKRFEDRISGFTPPPGAAGDAPGVSTIERSREGWRLTRRSLLGMIAFGTFAGLPRAYQAVCSTGAFAHSILITSLSFFPDGKTLVSAGQDSRVKFWTIPGAALFRVIATDAVPFQVAVSPDGNHIAVAMDGGHLELWAADGGTHRQLAGHASAVESVAFTPDSAQLVSVSLDRTTKIWSVADAKLLHSFSDTADVMVRVAVPRPAMRPVPTRQPVAQRRYLMTSGIQLYQRSLLTGAILKTAPGKPLTVSADSQFLASHDDVRLYMYAFPSLNPLVSVVENRAATSLAFSADGTRLAIAYPNAPARLYSAPDLSLVREMEANEGQCLAAAMDPQNSYLAVASGRSIRLYQLPTGARLPVCFMDIAASSPSATGTQYLWGGVLYTISCNASIPTNATCTCDCVPGNCPCVYDAGCSCVSDQGCGCDTDTGGCSCDGDFGCDCVEDIGCSCDFDFGCGCVDDNGCSCDSDYGCGCVGDFGCSCDGDFGCSCDGDVGCGCVDD